MNIRWEKKIVDTAEVLEKANMISIDCIVMRALLNPNKSISREKILSFIYLPDFMTVATHICPIATEHSKHILHSSVIDKFTTNDELPPLMDNQKEDIYNEW